MENVNHEEEIEVDGQAIDTAIADALIGAVGPLSEISDEFEVDYELVFKRFVTLAAQVALMCEDDSEQDLNEYVEGVGGYLQ